jgi:hypothetical protein
MAVRSVRPEPILSSPPRSPSSVGDATLSDAFLLRCSAKSDRLEQALLPKQGTLKPTNTQAEAVTLITHLKMSRLGLRSLRGVSKCSSLVVSPGKPPQIRTLIEFAQALYAYENDLEEVDDFSRGSGMRQLDTLHLESNHLSSAAVASMLHGCYNLKRL